MSSHAFWRSRSAIPLRSEQQADFLWRRGATCFKLVSAEAEHLLAGGTVSGEVVNLYQVEHRLVRIQTAMLDREHRAFDHV